MIKICLISLKSYPLFVNKSAEYFGGAELQMSLIAKELAKDKQFRVNLITQDYGQKKIVLKNKVKIIKTKINPFDFFKVLKTIDADLYVERTVNVKVFLVACFSKIFKKKFVYMVAHDWDVDNKWLYWLGLRFADLIVVQTQDQKTNLKKNFNLDSLIVPSLVQKNVIKKQVKKEFVLWVGRADDWKRPFKYLNLVEKNLHEKFVMICREGRNKKLFNQVKTRASRFNNLKFFSVVPFEKISEFFRKAKMLVNTSIAEGVPNTFLQAGLNKTPVLSLKVNPDKYLDKYNCGVIANNLKILNNRKRVVVMGQNHYNYVKKNHNFKNIDNFKRELLKLL